MRGKYNTMDRAPAQEAPLGGQVYPRPAPLWPLRPLRPIPMPAAAPPPGPAQGPGPGPFQPPAPAPAPPPLPPSPAPTQFRPSPSPVELGSRPHGGQPLRCPRCGCEGGIHFVRGGTRYCAPDGSADGGVVQTDNDGVAAAHLLSGVKHAGLCVEFACDQCGAHPFLEMRGGGLRWLLRRHRPHPLLTLGSP